MAAALPRAGGGVGPVAMSLRAAANPLLALGARLGLVSAPTLADRATLLGDEELSDSWQGHGKAPAVAELEVTGMTCSACSAAVERALLGVPGALLGFGWSTTHCPHPRSVTSPPPRMNTPTLSSELSP